MKPLNVGKLDRRIVIHYSSETADADTNEPVKTYSTLATVWAQRLTNASVEKFEADQQVALQTVRYRVRYRSDVAETMRIVDNGVVFEILGIEQVDRKSSMILSAQLRDNEYEEGSGFSSGFSSGYE
jgi:SPP1 family predicted phage head-tail adaptor